MTNPSQSGRKRRLIYLPAVNAHSFLLFFQKGGRDLSWSLRDYSQPGRVEVQYGGDLGWTAQQVLAMAEHTMDAPAIPATRLDFWHQETLKRNAKFGLAPAEAPAAGSIRQGHQFPLLAETQLLCLPKASKSEDMKRIRCSPNSEDWVTWNLLQLLQGVQPQTWWQTLNAAAAEFNPDAALTSGADDEPRLVFWHRAPAPARYESGSRQRMKASGVPKLVKRASSPAAVEGDSEIDAMVEARTFLVFLEAKLGSDVSLHTTYDPARNQIIRNIDCLIEAAAGREPAFWMLVRDTHPDRMYVQLIDQYRSKPALLQRDLPHRDAEVLRRIAGRLAIVRWRDLGAGWLDRASDFPLAESVRNELLKRI